MSERQRPRVGEILVQAGVIDAEQLRSALGEQARWGRPLGATLIKLGMVDETELVRALAGQLGLPMAKLDGKRIPPDVLALVPKDVAIRSMVIPLFVKRDGGRSFLYLGVEDPGNLEVFDDLAFHTGMEVKTVMVSPSELCEAIDRCYERTAGPEVGSTPPNGPDSVVTPGTEELARFWSQPAAPSQAASSISVANPAAPSTLSTSASAITVREASPAPAPDTAGVQPAVVQDSEDELVLETDSELARPPSAEALPTGQSLRAVIALLVEKGVMTRSEIEAKVRDLGLSGMDED